MRNTRFIRATVLGLVAALTTGGASFAQQAVPAETPPSSFRADQYVDSQGCVFVRVGFGSSTEWVPRVGRDRRQLCGYQPTRVAGAGPARGAADPANPGPGVTVIGGAPTTMAAAPRSAAPTQPRTVIRQTPAAVSTPGIRVLPGPSATRPTLQPVEVPAAPRNQTTCPGMTGLTAQYLSGPGVRCGPQAVHPGDAARGLNRPGARLNPVTYNGERVSPTGHVAARIQPPPAPDQVIPDGYVQVWQDGRINPMRGIRHISGEAEMAMIWTDTVPRRLVAAEPEPRVRVVRAGSDERNLMPPVPGSDS
ncbi:Calphotin [Roseibacterium elongatum DSM 19469]|uniref:Calphotin n=1 Tax=Roseicyclus elongatus DSM 19469 TaxID=1294273 RepID=W8STM1_9RHOB|nr:hypothetical protein [Roseibacterium elongatum]AHM05875.1 Calphotin [Roseibacterium elongatum DSM 19469]